MSKAEIRKEIERILSAGPVGKSRQQGKAYFVSGDLPKKLAAYLADLGLSMSGSAKLFNMSSSTLESILKGGQISDSMLLRLYAGSLAKSSKRADRSGDWKYTQIPEIQKEIAVVVDRLEWLRKQVRESNSLASDGGGIGRTLAAQLEAVLSAQLEALKAPLVSASSTRKAFGWLGKIAARAAEKNAESAIAKGIANVATLGIRIATKLLKLKGYGDLPDIWP